MLVIQDPTDERSTYLLESLIDAFRDAEKMGATFAFASAAGVKLLTEDESFQALAREHRVDIVVGIDAVTNVAALDSLNHIVSQYPNVTIRAFLNPRPEALYHPKFCWTRNRHGGYLIAGSGNLTEAGLLGNWEAYSIQQFDLSGINSVESVWDAWTERHAESLVPIDNPQVRQLASENSILAREGDMPTLVAPPAGGLEREPVTTQRIPPSAEVLIAEIPRSGNRWMQVNFHLADFVGFFGAKAGTARLMVFRHVNADGTMAGYERNRPPVTVQSRNFRFELAAAAGLPYPSNGRPIGVYVRVATRTFFYRLLLPGDPEYPTVVGLLQQHVGPPQAEMRSLRLKVAELRKEWPNSPFWKLPGELLVLTDNEDLSGV